MKPNIKKFTIGMAVGLLGFSAVVFAAPNNTYMRNILFETNNTYDVGSTTPALQPKNIYTQNLTVSGTCTGCGNVAIDYNPFTAASFVGTSTATSTISGGFYATRISSPYFHATSTTATSTISGGLYVQRGIQFDDLVSCDTINTDTDGFLTCGTDATGLDTFEWTPTSNFGVNANSTTTALWLRGAPYSLFASSTAVFVYASTTALSSSNLTSGRVTYAGTGGILQDNSNLTFDGTTLTSNALTVSGAGTSTDITGNLLVRGNTEVRGNLIVSVVGVTGGEMKAAYFTATSTSDTSTFTFAPTFSSLTSALVLTGAGGLTAEYTGTTCTSQFVTVLSALGAATCASINNDYWSGTDLSVANGGTGVSTFTSSQLLYGNGTNALSSVATTSLTATSPLSLSQPISVLGSSASALSLDTSGTWTGLAGTATALASDPTDCGSNTWATTIAASGNLTCSAITYAGITAMTSANFFGLISDETGGSGLVVGSASPTLTGLTTMTYASTTMLTTSAGATFATVSGNVGIGTTSPSKKLDIYKTESGDDYALRIQSSVDSGADVGLSIVRQDSVGARIKVVEAATDYLGFSVSGSGELAFAGNPQIVIDEQGELGIGNLAPEFPLDISYSTYPQMAIRDSDIAADQESEGFYFYNNSDFKAGIQSKYNGGTTDSFKDLNFFAGGNASTPKMTLEGTGNVGIGTTSPAALLSVHGGGYISSNLFVGGTITATSTVDFTSATTKLQGQDKSMIIASSTLAYIGSYSATGTTTVNVWNPSRAVIITGVYCKGDVGNDITFVGSGTATSTILFCNTAGQAVTGQSISIAARGNFYVQKGTASTTAPNVSTVTVTYKNND